MINGILNINKPAGITSAQVVSQIKKSLKIDKVGHAGTLDPFATGVLLIGLGKATKITQYLTALKKEYAGSMVLGIDTDTYDLEGKILKIRKDQSIIIKRSDIEKVFSEYQGEIFQKPPMFSAIKQNGLRLYQLARKGIFIERKPRKVKIYNLSMLDVKKPPYAEVKFKVQCSKGTYIRSLCHDIGNNLGCGAYVSKLIRTKIGNYSLEQSIELSYFLSLSRNHQNAFISGIDRSLYFLNKIILKNDDNLIKRVLNGRNITINDITIIKNNNLEDFPDKFSVYSNDGDFLAIAHILKNEQQQKNTNTFKIEKTFHGNN